jgi:hypothetical protein
MGGRSRCVTVAKNPEFHGNPFYLMASISMYDINWHVKSRSTVTCRFEMQELGIGNIV